MPCDVLFVAAFAPELRALASALGEGLSGKVGGLEVAARVVGIGATMSAAGTAMQLAELLPRRGVVALGTCGVYASVGKVAAVPAVGDVVVPSKVTLGCAAVADGWAEFPAPMSVAHETHPGFAAGLRAAGGRPGDVAATLAITVDDAAAGRLASFTGAAVEHLEAHGMAVACAARGVPFAAALGVANVVGSSAREEWRLHHKAAAAAAARVALAWLACLAGLEAGALDR